MFTRAIMACSISLGMAGCSNFQSRHAIADEIISEFSSAVAEKNIEKFKSLFLDEDVRWLAIVSNKDFLETYKNDPDHKKINDHAAGPFIEWVSRTKESTQMEFSNCKSSGDGDVMVADCEYAFYLGARKTNFGRECFLLVNTETGWKISGMAFSSTVTEKGR